MHDALDTATSGIHPVLRLAINGVLESERSGDPAARKTLSTSDDEKSVGPMEVDAACVQANQMGRVPERGEPIEFSAANEQDEHIDQQNFIPEGEPTQLMEVDDQAGEMANKMESARAQVAPDGSAGHRETKNRELTPAPNRQ
jgi:hypothetical protein